MSQKNKDLFRQEALQQLRITNQINERLNITYMPYWLIFWVIALIMITLLSWGFLGSIPTTVSGNGILLATQGGLYNAVAPEGNGRVISILVKPGDVVKKNEVVAILDNPDLEEKVKVAVNYQDELQQEYQKLYAQFSSELKDNERQMEEQNHTLNKIIEDNNQKLVYLNKFLNTRKLAFKKGLIPEDTVVSTTQEVYATQTIIKQTQKELQEIKVKQSNFTSMWKQRLDTLKLKISDHGYLVKDLKVKLRGIKEVKSPIQGVVTFIQASIGSKMSDGEIVATIATLAKNLDAIVYVPAENGKRIHTGMSALISPTTVKKEEFGSIKAVVNQVSLFPSTPKNMLSVLQNEDLVKEFTKLGVVIAVRINLKTDPTTVSGYAWTSSKGPEQLISAGTLVTSLITVRHQTPISLIIPAFKTLLGE